MSFELLKINFAESKLPKFKENKQKGFYSYGEKNDFPDSLLEFYNRSPKHGAIVRQKARFVTGSEPIIEGNAAAVKLIDFVNPMEGLQDLKSKIALDFEIFNGFCFEVHYNRLAQPSKFYHVDFSKVRTLNHTQYIYHDNWQKYKEDEARIYAHFNPETAKPFSTQLFYYKEYDAGQGVYPLPSYIHAMQYIEIDVEIANFHNNNIRNGFSNGTLIQLFKGEPTPEIARMFERKFKAKTTGTDNAGGVLIQFNEGNERPAEISHIQPSDMDEQFLQLNNTVQQEIFTAHAVTSPMLFGIKTEGQLGGRSELIEAYEIFHKSYVNYRQQKIDRAFTYVCDFIYPGVKLSTKDAEFISLDYVELYQAGVATLNEARAAIGLQIAESEGQQFNEVCEFERWNDNDLTAFEKFGELESEFEEVKMHFAELTDKEIKVLSVINADEKASIKEISATVKIQEDEALKIIRTLQENGKIKWTDNAIKITDLGKNEIKKSGGLDKIELRWKYAVSPEAPELRGKSRPFCIRLMQLGRIYTREDINQLSSILGYDVWKRRGGWYTVPASDPPLHIPHCRHEWKQVIVRRKSNG